VSSYLDAGKLQPWGVVGHFLCDVVSPPFLLFASRKPDYKEYTVWWV